MKSSFRPTSVDDLNSLCQFLARVFGISVSAPMLNPAVMAWKYWEPRHDFDGPRSYVLEKEGEISAHAGLWPVTFGEGETAVRGIHMIDWASAKEAPGAGLAIVQKLAALFDFIVGVGGTDMTRKVLPAFGFAEHTRVWRGAQPLRPVSQMLTHQMRNWKLAPRLARNCWLAAKGTTPFRNWKAKPITPDEISKDIADGPANAYFSPRPAAFFEYILRCPAAAVSLYGIFSEGKLQGHFAMSLLRGQARIAGVWLREPTKDAWAAAYYAAQQAARQLKGAYEIVAVGSEGPSQAGALQAGFQMNEGPPVFLLNKKKKLALRPEFQFQMSEDDEPFLDYGIAGYWT